MIILVLIFIIHIVAADIISIDLGSKFIKVGILSNTNIPIMNNIIKKERILNTFCFNAEKQVFGEDAEEEMLDDPSACYAGMSQLLGIGINSMILKDFKENGYPYEFVHTDRDTLKLKIPLEAELGEIYVTVEELCAMMFEYILKRVQSQTNDEISKIVVAVPSSFTLTQRQALLESAKLVNMHIDSIIDQTTASAITYMVTSQKQKPRRVVIMDVGSAHTQFSLFEMQKGSRWKSKLGNLKILGKEVIAIGDSDFSREVASMIVNSIEEFGYSSLLNDPKVVATIREKSSKCMEDLSTKRKVKINDIPFLDDSEKYIWVTREEFEQRILDLVKQMYGKFKELLNNLNLKYVGVSLLLFTCRKTFRRFS